MSEVVRVLVVDDRNRGEPACAALLDKVAGVEVVGVVSPAAVAGLGRTGGGSPGSGAATGRAGPDSTADPSPTPPECARDDISDSEMEVLRLLARGYDNASICHALYLSPSAVKNRLTRTSRRLGVESRLQLVIRAAELGWVTPALDTSLLKPREPDEPQTP